MLVAFYLLLQLKDLSMFEIRFSFPASKLSVRDRFWCRECTGNSWNELGGYAVHIMQISLSLILLHEKWVHYAGIWEVIKVVVVTPNSLCLVAFLLRWIFSVMAMA